MSSVTTTPINIMDELTNLDVYKYHPSGLLMRALDRLQDITNGSVTVVEPNNPFTYLLESSCLNTALATQEHLSVVKKLYPKLNNTEEEIYRHMSDYDYLDIFASPVFADVQFNISYNDFITRGYFDVVTNEYIFKIPRNFKVNVDNYTFTLPNPIVIKKYSNGVIDVKYDHTLGSDIFPLKTNYINFSIYSINQEEKYINFSLNLPEVDLETVEFTVEKSRLFKDSFTYNPKRKFYFMEAYHLKSGKWSKLSVTHNDDLYDIDNPTVSIKVSQQTNTVSYYIPPVYINSGKLSGKIKFVVYTTNGNVNVQFDDYKSSDFTYEYNKIFPDLELNEHTAALQLISKVIYLKGTVSGGSDKVPFAKLKEMVINNNVGDRSLPITTNQLDFHTNIDGFKLIRNVDVITDRIFGLELEIPTPTTKYPISKANFDTIELKTTLKELASRSYVTAINPSNLIIPEETVFELVNGKLVLLSSEKISYLKSLSGVNLVKELNSKSYLSTYYHYVITEESNVTKLNAYDLNSCNVKSINFKNYNQSAKIGINTSSSLLYKTKTGYELLIECSYKQYSQQLSYNDVLPYLVYSDSEGSNFYLKGVLHTVVNQSPVYKITIDSSFFINNNDEIYLNNFTDVNGVYMPINIGLNTNFKLLYLSNNLPDNFQPIDETKIILGSYLAQNNYLITIEEISIEFGTALTNLYKPCHTSIGVDEYKKYDADVPARYEYNVYDNNGAITHYKNDIIYGADGLVIYKHRKGDVVLDENNNPVVLTHSDLSKYFTFLLLDYKMAVANKPIVIKYKDYLKSYITSKIKTSAENVKDKLLERTEAFVTVPKTISTLTAITGDGVVKTLPSAQKISLDIYLSYSAFNDSDLRSSINYNAIGTIDSYLSSNTLVRKTELLDLLWTQFKEFIVSISITNFLDNETEYVELTNKNSRLGLNKLIYLDVDSYNIKEDVDINYKLAD